MSEEELPIPQPSGLPIIGNVTNLDKEYPLGSMVQLADQFGTPSQQRARPGPSLTVPQAPSTSSTSPGGASSLCRHKPW